MSFSADYVRANSRDLLMSRQLNPTLRAQPVPRRPTSDKGDLLRAATAELAATYPGFTNFTASVTIRQSGADRLRRGDVAANAGATTALASLHVCRLAW
jgi:hypothetical protein